MLSTLNLKRISCNACLSAGRLSINDTDDIDDSEGTTANSACQITYSKIRDQIQWRAKDLIMYATFHV